MGILERINEIEAEMARTQKNKATEFHYGQMKARLAKLRTQLMEGSDGGKGKGEGFEVTRDGDARVAMIGFPSVGKSSLLNTLTEQHSAVASYDFTTLTCVPGLIMYKGSRIQLLDLPGIVEGAARGVGRGRQVISVARSVDLILMILDATKDDTQRIKLTRELGTMGIRLNKTPADIRIYRKTSGGISVNCICDTPNLTEQDVKTVLQEYKMFNTDVIVREPGATVDDLIDVIEGNRKYVKCLYVYNKIDMLTLAEVRQLASEPYTVVISCNNRWNLDGLVDDIWTQLGLVRIFTKKRGDIPDFSDPVVMTSQRGRVTIENVVSKIHRSLLAEFDRAYVWGTSVKKQSTYPMVCGLDHELEDEDVVQVIKRN